MKRRFSSIPLFALSLSALPIASCADLPTSMVPGGATIALPGGIGSIHLPGSAGGSSPDRTTQGPSLPAANPTLPAGAAGFKVYVNNVVSSASSYVLATNRNHTSDNFPNGAAKLDKLKALRPTWGAGRYMYRIGHGVTDGRYDYGYMSGYHFEQAWDKNGSYPYDDLRNALREANTLDAEQLHVINFGTGDAAEAARYVSYLNNPSDSNRSAHPFAVQNAKFFELGNEISWSTERGHDTYAPNESAYARRAKEFAQAMRKASPTPIMIGAVATTNSNWLGDGWSGGATSVKNILQIMGNDVDFLIYHGYPSWPMKQEGNLASIMAQNTWNDHKLTSEIEPAIKQYASHPVYIANTEFFTELYSDANRSRGMFGAIYSADTLTLAFNHGIFVANQFCFDHQELSDASFFLGDDPNRVTPVYRLQALLAKHWGDSILKIESQAIPTQHVQGNSESVDMPALAIAAAKGKDGTIYALVTNRTNDRDVSAQLALGLNGKTATRYRITGNNAWSSGPEDVSQSQDSVSMDGSQTFPRASITLLEIKP